MAKITIGATHDTSKLLLRATILDSSDLELNVGDGTGMSTRQIEIIERKRGEIELALEQLKASAQAAGASPGAGGALRDQVSELAATAEKVVRTRKWYSFSPAGLLEAAKSVGAAADPILVSAGKLVALLSSAHG